jgi:transcriptional regulator with XRE-family HTH domain
VVAYRAEHGLSQAALGRILGMSQPAVARLEAGEHEPTFNTLRRLYRGLGMRFHIDVGAEGVTLETELVGH